MRKLTLVLFVFALALATVTVTTSCNLFAPGQVKKSAK